MSGLLTSKRWDLLEQDKVAEQRLCDELQIPHLVARVLCARGMKEPAVARDFLSPSLERDWADPLDIPGMREAADRVEEAISSKERIAVFGDFDVDGISSTVLLTLALRKLRAQVWPYIPYRFGEGYGLSEAALNRVIEGCDAELLITVDNGIAAAQEVDWLVRQGVDVVITDHHEPGDAVPSGVPVTDPKLNPDPNYCSRELAGAGVALKLVQELGRRFGQSELWRSYTDIATLGTLSDMMPLLGENRALVSEGIARMRVTDRPGLIALAQLAGISLSEISADTLPFSLIPRLNAAGRMGTSDVAFDLLLTDDMQEAHILAGKLEEINDERRSIESALAEEALEKVAHEFSDSRSIVVGGKGWHEGVKGIVASRIVNRYQVPAILFSITDGVARGSGRSVGSVDLFHAVEQCSDVLVRFGGHSGAVGVTCEEARLPEFASRLEEVLTQLPEEQFESRDELTALVELSELNVSSIAELEMLQPFGQANKRPLFGVLGATMRNRSCVGADGNHLRFLATDGVSSVPAIMFRAPKIQELCAYEGATDIVFEATNETWQGKTRPKLMVRDVIMRNACVAADDPYTQEFVDKLFDHAEESLSRNEYAGIASASSFMTKAVGVSFENRQASIAKLKVGDACALVRQPDNVKDPNAIALVAPFGEQIGFLRKEIAELIAPLMDADTRYSSKVLSITGGDEGRSLGVNIEVVRQDGQTEDEERARASATELRAKLAALKPSELNEYLRQKMIGDHELLPAQTRALELLSQNKSCLTVMATGRGKSLIFHIHAARTAIQEGLASIFVYPLRALVADQSFHLAQSLGDLGLEVQVLTGETGFEERDEIFAALESGGVDVILTTPEFLAIHRARFASSSRVGFIVIDEAHHAGLSKSGNRSAYAQLPDVLDALGSPRVLAVTATAATGVAQEICRLARIDVSNVIVDAHLRENLQMQEARNSSDREFALVRIVSSGDKSVIYVNSRDQAVSIARMLRQRVPELAWKIAFYHAGLSRQDRKRVEEAFRSGQLRAIVSTSAFGEGVNLPDIRNVVLYHMPFGSIEFNQMSGRAGRDGKLARVFLMFGERDTRINERIIASSAPEREDLVVLYRTLTELAKRAASQGEDSFAISNAEIAELTHAKGSSRTFDDRGVSCGISVFRELGFLETSGFSTARRIHMCSSPARMELSDSIRYLEGLKARDEFKEFSSWALNSSIDTMLARINRPITPDFGERIE